MISILTSALPERASMLDEAIASVKHQDVEVQHLYEFDHTRRGAGPVLNELLADAVGEWVMVLDDDDLLLPNHLYTLQPFLTDENDVVWSLPIVTGGSFTHYDRPFNIDVLERFNIVSHNALMRTSLVRELGGWEAERDFDWRMFKALAHYGARFHRSEDKTWEYRLHGSNWSRGTLA